MFTWKEIIAIAVQIENNGEQTYRRAAEHTKDHCLSQELSRLADEEAGHSKWFSELTLQNRTLPQDPELEKIARVFLRETVADQTFSLQEDDITSVAVIADLIEKSIAFEQDTIIFYETIRHLVSDQDTIDLLDTIIDEEKNHIVTLKKWIEAT